MQLLKKANGIEGSIKRGLAAKQSGVTILLCSVLIRPLVESCNDVWVPEFKKDIEKLDNV